MLFDQNSISLDVFLENYWQKKPLLVRQAFPDFKPALDENDVAGLCCDELAESRLITGNFPQNNWTLRYGPFEDSDFDQLPERNWTLLVQDAEKHYPPLRSLLQEFDFIPRWRIDDLMISVAGPGGSVGPHVDQYDVFLLQASGRRRWQIAESFEPALQPDIELNVLRQFNAEQDWLLEPGDLLYLPPGVAHHGVAVDQCMTWSVGLRAPSSADLLQSMGEWLAADHDEGTRYQDPQSSASLRPGEVNRAATEEFRQLVIRSTSGDAEFERFLGAFLSRYRLAQEPAAPPEKMTAEELLSQLRQGHRLQHNPWTRLLWIEAGNDARLFAAGEEITCDIATAMMICDPPRLATCPPDLEVAALNTLCKLLNNGHLYLESHS